MTEDDVKALFAQANPIPNPGFDMADDVGRAAQLDAILERSSEMTKTEIPREERAVALRRLVPWLVAAAVIVVAGTIVLLTRQSPIETPVVDTPRAVETAPTTAPPTTTQPLELAIEPGVVNVESFIAAFNARDAVTIDEVTNADYPFTWSYAETIGGEEFTADSVSFLDLLFAMDARWEVVEPCAIAADDPDVIHCTISVTDRFQGPAGMDHTSTFLFEVDDSALVAGWRDLGCCDLQRTYTADFWEWLQLAHPDVFVAINPGDMTSVPGWQRLPSHMTTALDYVDEFVAQSDKYPLTSS